MLKINLDNIEDYKKEAIKAKGALRTAKNKLNLAASTMGTRGIDSDLLSVHNLDYNYAALDKRRKDIITKINNQVTLIDTLIGLLDDVDDDCDSYCEDVTNDEDEILKLLGEFISEDYGNVTIEDFVENNDILTFDIANCDYYVNKDGVKIYVNIPHGKTSEERYKILDVTKGSLIKKLYSIDDKYSVVLLKNDKDGRIRIGYIENEDMNPTFSEGNGTPAAKSNLEDNFVETSGYGIVKDDKVIVRPFPNSDQGEDTSSKYHSRDTYMTELKSGTRVKIVGQWLNDEQDARKSYLVAFNSDSGNFMGFVDGDALETGKQHHSYNVTDVSQIVMNKDTNIYCIDGVNRPAKAGTAFKFENESQEGYVVSYLDENNNETYAFIEKDNADMIIPDSISKIGYGN